MQDEKSNDGLLQVTLTANRKIKAITIDESLLEDKEQLEDYLILVLNKAIEKALLQQGKDEVLLILGKGDETYQEIQGKKYPFDDREVVKSIIAQWAKQK